MINVPKKLKKGSQSMIYIAAEKWAGNWTCTEIYCFSIYKLLLFIHFKTHSAITALISPQLFRAFINEKEIINFAFLLYCTLMTSIPLIRWSKQTWAKKARNKTGRIFLCTALKSDSHLLYVFHMSDTSPCVLARHQFSIIISRFSRISRNIVFFLTRFFSLRDFCSLRKNLLFDVQIFNVFLQKI